MTGLPRYRAGVQPQLAARPARRLAQPTPDRVLRVALLSGALALLIRLALLASPFGGYDGDAAVNGLMAQDLLHGRHLWLVWAGQQYAGTADAGLQAVSIRLLGVGQVAVGLPLALLGSGTVGLLSWTAGRCLRSAGAAAAVGLTTSAYPLWMLVWGTAVGGGGYALSVLLGVGALSIALTRRPLGAGAVAAVGLLSGLALWSQPLAASLVAVAGAVALLSAGSVRRALRLAPVLVASTLPGLAIWAVGLHDGTDRQLSPLQNTLTLHTVLDRGQLAARARALHGIIGDKALGLVAGDGPDLLPAAVVRGVVAAFSVAVLVAIVGCVLRPRGPLVPALLGVLVLAGALFVLFPPSLDTATAARNVGVPRPLGVPRYVYPGMWVLSALAGLAVWALVRRRGAPGLGRGALRPVGGLLAGALLASSAWSAHVLLEPGAYTRTRPSTAQLQAFAHALTASGARCVVGGYWDVYPLVLASDNALRGESTFVNRMGTVCGTGPGVATLFTRTAAGPAAPEIAYAATRPGERIVPGPGLVAYVS